MTKIFTKLRALVDEALSDRDTAVDKVPTIEKAPVEQDLFDHRLLYIEEDTNNIDTGGFILNSILHLLGNWCLSLFGIFFNPIALGEKGSTMRFEKKGIIQFDL